MFGWDYLGWIGLAACAIAACSKGADADAKRETHGGADAAGPSNAGGTSGTPPSDAAGPPSTSGAGGTSVPLPSPSDTATDAAPESSSDGSGRAPPEPPPPDARAPWPTEDCDDVLAVVRTTYQARCVQSARCEQVQQEPDRVLQWHLFIDEYVTDAAGNQHRVSDAELEHRAGCVAGWLEQQGQSSVAV